MPMITIGPEPIQNAESREVLDRYLAELNQRFPAGFDTHRSTPPAPGDFMPPAGVFLLVRADGVAAGCGALRTEESDGIGEIRRMWIAPELRGLGTGRRLLAALEHAARERGCHTVRLDTAAELHEAKVLYSSSGYREIQAYNDNPYAQHWFEKQLV